MNEVIRQDLSVVEKFYPIVEAEKKFNLTDLPENAPDKIRIIKIGGYDACPCSGLHVSHTKEIGRFKIASTNYNDSVLRIRFKLFNE